MKKENIYIDLGRCSEEELKNIYTILGDTLKFIAPSIVFNFPIMHYHEGMWIRTNFYQDKAKEDSFLEDKTELTYPEFIKLFEGGEGENETYSFSYLSCGKTLTVHIEAKNFNKAMIEFATNYHDIEWLYHAKIL